VTTRSLPFHHRLASSFLIAWFTFQGVAPTRVLAGPAAVANVAVLNTYDGNGNLTQRTDGNGAITQYTYDQRDRLVAIDYPGGASPDVTFAYDQNGNRIRMTDATGTTSYDYDLFDRLIGIDNPDGGFVRYGYDAVGNVTERRYGNYISLRLEGVYTYVRYGYNADNRIATVQNGFTSNTTAYAYDAAGNVTRRTLPNNAYTDYGYDADGRQTNVVHRKADNSLIVQFGYTLNAIGNRTRMIETTNGGSRTTSYTYDNLDRLDTVQYPGGRFVDYDYDSFGNRTRMAETNGATVNIRVYSYDSDSRLLSNTLNGVLEETFAYDTTGNLVQRYRATDNRLIDYVYDVENRLVRYVSGTNNIEYVYNGVGERVAKVVNGVRTHFLNDPNRDYVQVLAEMNSSGSAQRVYQWGNELIDQENALGGSNYFYLHDATMGSVRRLVNSSAGVVNSYEYDAFGKPTIQSEGVLNDPQFHGESYDDQTDLAFFRARFYDVEIGRFTSRDPVRGESQRPQSQNPYAFVVNDPVNRRDPTGLSSYLHDFLNDVSQSSFSISYETEHGNGVVSSGYQYFLSGRSGPTTSGGHSWGSPQANFGYRISQSVGQRPSLSFEGTYRGFGISASAQELGVSYTLGRSVLGRSVNVAFSTPYSSGRWTPLGIGSLIGRSIGKPGGVALNKSADVLLDINNIKGATFDPNTGQILLYGLKDTNATALPKMNVDDLAVAFRAVSQGTMPVVSIEDPIVSSPPDWPGRDCFTVRYGPFYTDPLDGQTKVLDVSSRTHFGWVMFDADRQMKCLSLGQDNRTLANVGSSVGGYLSLLDLAFTTTHASQTQTRYWFNPKEIQIKPSPDGTSMELLKAEMQLSTETMFSSDGNVESTADAEYFANWFTQNYDAIANEQVTYDHTNGAHYIFKELKQLAALVGIVKWVQDNNIPVDLSFLESYTPAYYPPAQPYTPRTSVTRSQTTGNTIRTVTIFGGVNYCNDLDFGTNGNPQGLAAAAMGARATETNLAWTFNQSGTNYNTAAISTDRKEKDGGFSHNETDAQLKVNGAMPLELGRYFDSFDVRPTMFGWGWQAQPYALEFRGERTKFNLCAQDWEGYGEVYFNDRSGQRQYKFVPSGIYNRTNDPLRIASRFATNTDILVYSFETKDTPGQLFSDNKTRMVMRLADGMLLDFGLDGKLAQTQDRNGNTILYSYDAGKRLVSIGQPGGRAIAFNYSTNRVTNAVLPDAHSVTYLYDASGNLASAQYDAGANGRIMRYAYNADHCLTEVQDESGNAVQSHAYDVYGRVAGTTQPGVAMPVAHSFNLATRRTQTTGPGGLSQGTEFNPNFDPTATTDSRSNRTERTYNAYRDVKTERMADGRTYQHFYDSRGNRMATLNPNGRADMTFLDVNANPTLRFHSPGGTNFTSQFDAENVIRDVNFYSYAVGVTVYEYDTNGNLTAVIDANSRTNKASYDTRGNRVLQRDARGFATGFLYDTNSRLVTMTNALGHRVDYSHDNRDKITRTATAAGTVDQTFNAKNDLAMSVRGDVGARRTNSFTYNERHQLLTVAEPNGVVTDYTYDARGNLTQIRHNGVVRFTYEYDGLNRLTATRYSGTTGGGKASIVPLSPRGTETYRGSLTITWAQHGDWAGNTNVALQYSVDGLNWSNIATVAFSAGSYTWTTGTLVSDSVRLRFVRPGDASFIAPVTSVFKVLNGGRYYVNDGSTAGDLYCTAAGQPFNGITVRGLTPGDPVNSVQAIINNYPLQPGDIVHVDTGVYQLTNDIVLTAADQGSPAKPLTFTGPTNGNAAIIVHTRATNSVACLFLSNATGVVVQNLTFRNGAQGVQLLNSVFCTLRNLECSSNGVAGAAGTEGVGGGIRLSGEGYNLIEGNTSHHNGGNGWNASANQDGGPGRGYGIIIEASLNNVVRSNICAFNGAIGGSAGSTNNVPGYSEGAGIFIQSISNILTAGNRVTDNVCYSNSVAGASSTGGSAGRGQSFGIALLETTNSTIERNLAFNNNGYGGNSSNANGGLGWGAGIYGQGEKSLTVFKNNSYSNGGWGGTSGPSSSSACGNGDGGGIYLKSCSTSIVKNNLSRENSGFAHDATGAGQPGLALGYGVRLENSPGCEVSNNTLYRNSAAVGFAGSGTLICGQVFLGDGCTNSVIKNNILEAYHQYAYAIYVSLTSVAGTVSDYNDLFPTSGRCGYWGNSSHVSPAFWRANTGQDGHSLSTAPQFRNAAAGDFHLVSSSPLIDAGQILATVQEDGDSEPRPFGAKQDIGYDEFTDNDGDGLSDQVEKFVTLTNPNESDSDLDGLPDGWEVANGLNPLSGSGANGANGDPDGDSYTNIQELTGGSNPTLGSSVPPVPPVITSFTPSGTSVFLIEEEDMVFQATATDGNNDLVSYQWRLDGVVQSTSNRWTFATTSTSSGVTTLSKSYAVELRVTAGADVVTRSWNVVVNNRNHAPLLSLLTNLTVRPGATVSLTPVFVDPDNQNAVPGDDNVLSVSYSGWMTNATKVTTGQDRGQHLVTVTVADDGNPRLTAEQTIQITVDLPSMILGPVQKLGSGQLGLSLTGVSARNCAVEFTSNFLSWLTATNFLVTNDVITFNLAPPSNYSRAFFRVNDHSLVDPYITIHPISQTANAGQTIVFNVSASSAAPLNYRWYKDGAGLTNAGRINGANSSQLNVTSVVSGDAGSYFVTVSNGFGVVTSLVATLTVVSTATASFSATLNYGCSSVTAVFTDTSSGDISNRLWRFGDGTTSNTTATTISHTYNSVGTNSVTLIVSGSFGSSTNTQTNLVVVAPSSPLLVVSPDVLDFGSVPIGIPVQASITVSNAGSCLLNGTATTESPLAIAAGATYTLAGHTSTNVIVSFTPSGAFGIFSLIFFTSDGGNTTVYVFGSGQ
jgi:RHS repeat-associated protein